MSRHTASATGRHRILYLRLHSQPGSKCQTHRPPHRRTWHCHCRRAVSRVCHRDRQQGSRCSVLIYLVTATRQDVYRSTNAILSSICIHKQRDGVQLSLLATATASYLRPSTCSSEKCQRLFGVLPRTNSLSRQTCHRCSRSQDHVSSLKTHRAPLQSCLLPKANASGER